MIMIKDKLLILFIALMCVSPVSSSFMVICYGNDGHVSIESADHDHCDCPGSEAPSHEQEFSNGLSSDHSHCKDTLAASSIVISVLKKQKLAKVFAQNLYQKPISARIKSSCERLFSSNTELSSFFTPLRSIVILA